MCICQDRDINAASPRGLCRQGVRRIPSTFDHAGRRIDRASGLLSPIETDDVLHKAGAQSLIPSHTVDIDGVGLGGVYAHVEGYVLTFVDAGGRGVAFNLASLVGCRGAKRDSPLAGA